jgi:hypothetical protein
VSKLNSVILNSQILVETYSATFYNCISVLMWSLTLLGAAAATVAVGAGALNAVVERWPIAEMRRGRDDGQVAIA